VVASNFRMILTAQKLDRFELRCLQYSLYWRLCVRDVELKWTPPNLGQTLRMRWITRH
jgi:hypothetical protein